MGFPWTGALRDGWRACERGIGPPMSCGAFNLQKLAEVPTTQGVLCKGGARWSREGAIDDKVQASHVQGGSWVWLVHF